MTTWLSGGFSLKQERLRRKAVDLANEHILPHALNWEATGSLPRAMMRQAGKKVRGKALLATGASSLALGQRHTVPPTQLPIAPGLPRYVLFQIVWRRRYGMKPKNNFYSVKDSVGSPLLPNQGRINCEYINITKPYIT